MKPDSPSLITLRRIGALSRGRGPIIGSPFSTWRVNHETPPRIQISNFVLLFFLAIFHLKFWQNSRTNFQFSLFLFQLPIFTGSTPRSAIFAYFLLYVIFLTLQVFLPLKKKLFPPPLEASVKEITISRLISYFHEQNEAQLYTCNRSQQRKHTKEVITLNVDNKMYPHKCRKLKCTHAKTVRKVIHSVTSLFHCDKI